MDLTENLPLDLYPDQDVLIAIDRGPEEERCVGSCTAGARSTTPSPTEPVRLSRY